MTDVSAPGAAGQGSEAPNGSAALLNTPPPAAPTTEGTPAAAPAAAPATVIPWLEGADDATVGYVQNKGWQEPKQVLEGYRNLEKLLGADRAGNTVVLPKPDATPEEIGKFFDRLGRPSDPAGYKISIPEQGGDGEFAKAAAGKFHELGLTQKQGEALANWWNESAAAAQKAQADKLAADTAAELAALDQEWGAAKVQNIAAAQSARRALGLDDATMDKLDAALGPKGTIQLLHKIGSKMGEPDFVTGDKTERFGSAMTPAQAQAAIQAKMQDKNFVSRYLNHDAEATAEMKRLHEWAHPEL